MDLVLGISPPVSTGFSAESVSSVWLESSEFSLFSEALDLLEFSESIGSSWGDFLLLSSDSVLVLTSTLTPKEPNRALITSPRLLRSLIGCSLESLDCFLESESWESLEFKWADSKAVLTDSSVALTISPIFKRSFMGLLTPFDSSGLQYLELDSSEFFSVELAESLKLLQYC